MTTSHGSDQGSSGSSRYDSSPVGGPGEGRPRRPSYGAPPTQPAPGSGYGEQTPPPDPGYEPKTPPEGEGYKPETPEGEGYPPETPETPEVPQEGYGPEDPQYDEPSEPPGTPPPADHPCPPSMTCDVTGIDDLECEALGVKAESEALAKVATHLATRRTNFETARSAYTQAREAATQAVKDLKRRIDVLLDDTRCLLNKDEVDCIDRAFGHVLDCLEDCSDEQGCCIDEGCGFESETWTVGQMEDLRVKVEKVEKCFDEVLVPEPAAVTKRVDDIKKLVDALAEAMKADPREEANRLYARAKHAGWMLDNVWGRFADVNEFQECLCCGLTCSLRGRQWLAQLEGKKAYEECQEQARLKRCDWLRKNIVDETLATQLVLCPPGTGCGDKPSVPDEIELEAPSGTETAAGGGVRG
jgi:hypothetical protein